MVDQGQPTVAVHDMVGSDVHDDVYPVHDHELEVTPAGIAACGPHHRALNPSSLNFLTCEMGIASGSFETSN